MAEKDIQVGQYLIPKGSQLLMPFLPMHRYVLMTLHEDSTALKTDIYEHSVCTNVICA